MQATTKMNFKIKDADNFKGNGPQTKKFNQNKSKFTIFKKVSADKLSTGNQKSTAVRKSNITKSFVNKTMPINKIVVTEKPYLKKSLLKHRNTSPAGEKLKLAIKSFAEIYVQTNESEILNHSLIVGDYRIMIPSKSVVNEIEKRRKEKELKQQQQHHTLKANNTRKFEKHSQKEEQQLDNLNEFLDKCYISKKSTGKINENIFDEDRKILASMDELLQREKPKIESITDIRSRIQQKEQDLLRLFNHNIKKTEIFGTRYN